MDQDLGQVSTPEKPPEPVGYLRGLLVEQPVVDEGLVLGPLLAQMVVLARLRLLQHHHLEVRETGRELYGKGKRKAMYELVLWMGCLMNQQNCYRCNVYQHTYNHFIEINNTQHGFDLIVCVVCLCVWRVRMYVCVCVFGVCECVCVRRGCGVFKNKHMSLISSFPCEFTCYARCVRPSACHVCVCIKYILATLTPMPQSACSYF